MRDAGILFDEVNVDSKVDKKSKIKTLSDMTISELNNSLDLSINDENYEFAARIRDEIKKRN
jgi:protein-arginine kinase activator protein McsA